MVLLPLAVAVWLGIRLAAWARPVDHPAKLVYGIGGLLGLFVLWLAFAGAGVWLAMRPTPHEEALADQTAFRQRR
ncbi:MAG: hypothetical protein AABY18_07445 [Candidatus Thermoplasmatota archaeon]